MVFLYRNLEFAYTPREIAEALEVPRGTATTTLRRLHEQGYIGRIEDGYYYGLDDREDLRRYPRSVAETEAMFASHPDAETAPTPDPERPADAVDDETLESELVGLEDDIDE